MTTTQTRPALADPHRQPDADRVAAAFAKQLQDGLDTTNADAYDQSFAADLLWGSPYGKTLSGFDTLLAIHRKLMADQAAPPSQFEVVAAISPAPDVVVTQIRRRASDSAGFSEMALYTLVERDGHWWVAAGQNTPIVEH